jgi:hypothetical protein
MRVSKCWRSAGIAESVLGEKIVDKEGNAIAANFRHQFRGQRWAPIKTGLEVTAPPDCAELKGKRGYFWLLRAQTP